LDRKSSLIIVLHIINIVIVMVCGGCPTTDTINLKGIAATIGQHHVGFQVYCMLHHYSFYTRHIKLISNH
jgi:hypothetical protein